MPNQTGFKIGQQDSSGVEITTGSIIENYTPEGVPGIVTYVRELAAFLCLTPELHKEYGAKGVLALEGYEPQMLMVLANETQLCQVNGTIETRPEILK